MRARRILAAATMALLVGVVPSTRTDAHAEACVGHLSMTTSAPFFYPGIASPASGASFVATMWFVGCTSSGSLLATGTVNGFCGAMTGAGTANGHLFGFVVVGSVIVMVPDAIVYTAPPGVVIRGIVSGTGPFIPDFFVDSCFPGLGADQFLGTVVLATV